MNFAIGVFIIILFGAIFLWRFLPVAAQPTPKPTRQPFTFVVCPNMQIFDYWCRQHYTTADRARTFMNAIAVTPTRVNSGYIRGYQWQEGDRVEYQGDHLITTEDYMRIRHELKMIGCP